MNSANSVNQIAYPFAKRNRTDSWEALNYSQCLFCDSPNGNCVCIPTWEQNIYNSNPSPAQHQSWGMSPYNQTSEEDQGKDSTQLPFIQTWRGTMDSQSQMRESCTPYSAGQSQSMPTTPQSSDNGFRLPTPKPPIDSSPPTSRLLMPSTTTDSCVWNGIFSSTPPTRQETGTPIQEFLESLLGPETPTSLGQISAPPTQTSLSYQTPPRGGSESFKKPTVRAAPVTDQTFREQVRQRRSSIQAGLGAERNTITKRKLQPSTAPNLHRRRKRRDRLERIHV